jgi:hypothetical protein
MKNVFNYLTKKDLDSQGLTPLHYIVGGLAGIFIASKLYGSLTFFSAILSFIAWPLVFAWGFFVLIIKVITFIASLIF